MIIFPAGSPLVDILARAKTMQAKNAQPRQPAAQMAPPSKTAQQKLVDQLDISPALQEKLDKSNKVNGYLQLFSAALKWINKGKALPDIRSQLDKLENSGQTATKVDTRI
ncbi:MAG: hypothetical protein WC989_09070 [Micavibrio sp.]